jgi:hypothetical protein
MNEARKPKMPTTYGLETDTQATDARVERLRERLLDLSKKNGLLNFRHSERSRTHIRVIDEVPEFLFDRLIGGGFFTFKPIPRPPAVGADGSKAAEPSWQKMASSVGVDTSVDLPVPSAELAPRHQDNAIQLPYFPEVADRKLEGIRQTYLTFLEEMGIPSLFGAFGFLEWRESESDDPQHAPLVLLPLEIDREKSGYRYVHKARAASDEAEGNLSLALRLKKLGIDLPIFDSEDANVTLGGYLDRVAAAVKHMNGWCVRRFVTIGIFQFARQVMYQD